MAGSCSKQMGNVLQIEIVHGALCWSNFTPHKRHGAFNDLQVSSAFDCRSSPGFSQKLFVVPDRFLSASSTCYGLNVVDRNHGHSLESMTFVQKWNHSCRQAIDVVQLNCRTVQMLELDILILV